MIRHVDHIVITSTNRERTAVFYAMLGFEVREAPGRWELFAGDFKINVHLFGHELEPKARMVQPGSVDVCFEIDGSIEVCRDALLAAGIAIELGIVERHGVRGVMRSLYVRDPDGNLIELCSYE
ncbi:MAG: hypothetical protein RR547_08525 [Raoultibacter sp.]